MALLTYAWQPPNFSDIIDAAIRGKQNDRLAAIQMLEQQRAQQKQGIDLALALRQQGRMEDAQRFKQQLDLASEAPKIALMNARAQHYLNPPAKPTPPSPVFLPTGGSQAADSPSPSDALAADPSAAPDDTSAPNYLNPAGLPDDSDALSLTNPQPFSLQLSDQTPTPDTATDLDVGETTLPASAVLQGGNGTTALTADTLSGTMGDHLQPTDFASMLRSTGPVDFANTSAPDSSSAGQADDSDVRQKVLDTFYQAQKDGTPSPLDCGKGCNHAFKAAGVPATGADDWTNPGTVKFSRMYGEKVGGDTFSQSQLTPGDWVIYHNGNGSDVEGNHSGIYLGDNDDGTAKVGSWTSGQPAHVSKADFSRMPIMRVMAPTPGDPSSSSPRAASPATTAMQPSDALRNMADLIGPDGIARVNGLASMEQQHQAAPGTSARQLQNELINARRQAQAPSKAPTTRSFADGTTQQWDPDSKTWSTVATKAAPANDQSRADYLAKAYPDGLKTTTINGVTAYQTDDGSLFTLNKGGNGRWQEKTFNPNAHPARLVMGTDGQKHTVDASGNPTQPLPEGVALGQAPHWTNVPGEGAFVTTLGADGKMTSALMIPDGLKMDKDDRDGYRDAVDALHDTQEKLGGAQAAADKDPTADKKMFGGSRLADATAAFKSAQDKIASYYRKYPSLAQAARQLNPSGVIPPAAGSAAPGPTPQQTNDPSLAPVVPPVPSAAPDNGGAVTVTTKAARDALASGTVYIGPDGKKYVKK